MSYFHTPTKKRSGFIGDTSTVDYSSRLGSSSAKYDDFRSRFDDIIGDVNEKKDNSNRGVTQVVNANRALAVYLREQQEKDMEHLEEESIQLKKQLNSELKKNNQIMSKLGLMEGEAEELAKRVTSDKDLQAQNAALKARLLRQNDEYNKLYYELELLKSEGDRIRNQTKAILERRLK